MDALASHRCRCCYWGFFSESSSSIRAAGRRRPLPASHSEDAIPISCWIRSPGRSRMGRAVTLSVGKKPIRWIPSPASSSSSTSSLPSAPEAGEVIGEFPVQTSDQSKTVHVRFVLQKACLFGQQFLILGDHPIVGQWDPSNAVPLEWFEGHVWTAELIQMQYIKFCNLSSLSILFTSLGKYWEGLLPGCMSLNFVTNKDLPVGKSIQFKFVLRGVSGEINWQPGHDRVLQIWETKNTIVVTGDWENAENQKIIEEEPLAIATEEVISTESKIGSNGRPVIDETQMVRIEETQEIMTDETRSQSTNDEKQLSSCEGDTVLVPGLTVVPVAASAFPEEVANGRMVDTSLASDEAENCNTFLQLSAEQEDAAFNGNLLQVEETMTMPEKPRGDDDLAIATEEVISTESKIGSNGRPVIDETQMARIEETQEIMTDETRSQSTNDEKQLSSCEGDTVLVPGLTLVPVAASAFPEEVANGRMVEASLPSDEAENCNAFLQLSGEQEAAASNGNLPQVEETMTMPEKPRGDDDLCSEGRASYDDDDLSSSKEKLHSTGGAQRNNHLWGLHQLLLNLGFKMNPPLT